MSKLREIQLDDKDYKLILKAINFYSKKLDPASNGFLRFHALYLKVQVNLSIYDKMKPILDKLFTLPGEPFNE
jgi:hypothetical protein